MVRTVLWVLNPHETGRCYGTYLPLPSHWSQSGHLTGGLEGGTDSSSFTTAIGVVSSLDADESSDIWIGDEHLLLYVAAAPREVMMVTEKELFKSTRVARISTNKRIGNVDCFIVVVIVVVVVVVIVVVFKGTSRSSTRWPPQSEIEERVRADFHRGDGAFWCAPYISYILVHNLHKMYCTLYIQ